VRFRDFSKRSAIAAVRPPTAIGSKQTRGRKCQVDPANDCPFALIGAAPTYVCQDRVLPCDIEFHRAPGPRAGQLASSGRSTSSGHRGAAWDAASRTAVASTSIDVCGTSKSRHSNTKVIGPAGGSGSHQNSWDHLRPPPPPPLGWRVRTDVFPLGTEFHRPIALDPSANPMPKRSSPPVGSIPGWRKPSGDGAGLSRLIATSEKAKPVG
jgi:hypothetical protein